MVSEVFGTGICYCQLREFNFTAMFVVIAMGETIPIVIWSSTNGFKHVVDSLTRYIPWMVFDMEE